MIPTVPSGYYAVSEFIRRRNADPLPPMSSREAAWLGIVLGVMGAVALAAAVGLVVVAVLW